MIRIVRDDVEPKALARARMKHLRNAMAAYAIAGAPSAGVTAHLTGYNGRPVKETLYRNQHRKCAWCERRHDFSSSPVEHYRPKDGAWRHRPGETPRRVSPAHYWWLTWSWDNLLYSCTRCNDRGHKANYFPLAAGSAECLVPSRSSPTTTLPTGIDLSCERPLLLDPATDTFLDHVRWKPFNTTLARKLWTWSPDALTERGQVTIDILKLGELADDVQLHLATVILPGVEEVEQHLRGRRVNQAATRWTQLLGLLAPDKPLTAATWCALERWMDSSTRSAHGLAAPTRPT